MTHAAQVVELILLVFILLLLVSAAIADYLEGCPARDEDEELRLPLGYVRVDSPSAHTVGRDRGPAA